MLHIDNENINSHQEAAQNPTGCAMNATPDVNVSEGNSMVCGQDNYYHESFTTYTCIYSSGQFNPLWSTRISAGVDDILTFYILL